MAITQSSSFIGTAVDQLFEDLVLGAESIEKGLIDIFADKRNAVHLNRFTSPANPLVPRVATPTSAGDWVKDEKIITPGKAMFYREYNPLDFGFADWEFLWSTGTTVRAEAAAALLQAILSTSQKQINANVDLLTWQGDTLSGDDWIKITDGYIKLFSADSDVVDTTPAAITAANVISVLEAVVAACPAAVQEASDPTIITDHQTKYFYREAARALDFKGTNIDAAIGDTFGGFPLVSVGGMPASTIVMCNTGGSSSNLKASTWMVSDMLSNQHVERLQANSDLFFTKASFDYGVSHVFGSEIVMHKAA